MPDLVHQLGPLAFASRLKRLSDRLYRDISRVYAELDVDFEARWFLVLYLLNEESPLGVTEVAERLGLTHPAVNQIVAAMSRHGLIRSKKDKQDERRRLLALTARGVRLGERLAPVWRVVSEQTDLVLTQSGFDCLAALDEIEGLLDAQDMYVRVTRALKQKTTAAIAIGR